MKRDSFAAWTIVAVAIVARLYSAIRFPFEQDELYTIDEATNLFHTKLLPGIQARPVFFLLEHPFVTHFSTAEPVLRLVALAFGIIGLWALWTLADRAIGRLGALTALLLVAISPWHLYASAFARYYSLLFVLAALTYRFLPRAYDTDTPRDFLVALVPMLLGAWTHPSFAFPVAGSVLALTLIRRDGTLGWRWPSRNAWTYLYAPLVAGSLLIFVAIHVVTTAPTTVANGGDRGVAATLRLIPAMVDWMTLSVAVASLVGTVLLLRSGDTERRRSGLMVLCASVATLVALFALSFITSIYADYGISALPLLLVAAAYPVVWLAEGVGAQRARAAAIVAVAIIVSGVVPSALSYLSDGTRFDYRPAFARIIRMGSTTPVLTWPIVEQRRYAPQLSAKEFAPDSTALERALRASGDLWVVTSVKRRGIALDDEGVAARWLADHCRQIDSYQRPRLDYRLYRVDLWRCTLRTAGAPGTTPPTT